MSESPLTCPETIQEAIRHDAAMAFHGCDRLAEERHRQNAADRAGRGRAALAEWQAANAPRLVKALKSPTRPEAVSFCNQWEVTHRAKPAPKALESQAPDFAPNVERPGAFAVVESRRWAGEFRIRTEVEPGNVQPPEPQTGPRWTDMLTERGARKIAESCYYVAKMRGGYTTFMTLTLTPEARERLHKKIIVPKYPVSKLPGREGMPVTAEKPTETRGRLGRAFDPAGTVAEVNADRHDPRDPETGALYTPMIEKHEWSVQREVSRFLEAAGKMYARGWQYENDRGKTVKVPGAPDQYHLGHLEPETEAPYTPLNESGPYTALRYESNPFDYLWVAECPGKTLASFGPVTVNPFAIKHAPIQEPGDLLKTKDNPHVHVMMRWRVPYRHFAAWAERIEALWGQGTAHLEKIKDPSRAGAYVAKAAGYLCKAQGKADQGQIRGNRYGIAQRARAPAWIEERRYQLGVMGWLLAEAAEQWEIKHGDKIRKRERLKSWHEKAEDKRTRQQIGRILEDVRKQIEPLPRCSKYQALLKSQDQLKRFMGWAKRQGFQRERGTGQWLQQWREAQWRRRRWHPWQDVPEGVEPTGHEITQWLEMADAGAFALDESDLMRQWEEPELWQ